MLNSKSECEQKTYMGQICPDFLELMQFFNL